MNGFERSNGTGDIDDLITGSLRDRAARAPGRPPGMSGVRRRVRRRQQRHAVLAVAPVALMAAYLTTRDSAVGVLPASGVDGGASLEDTTAMSMEVPTTDGAIDCAAAPPYEGMLVSDEVLARIEAGEETVPVPTTDGLRDDQCVYFLPTTTMAPGATVTTVVIVDCTTTIPGLCGGAGGTTTIDWNDPALNSTSTTVTVPTPTP